jgi:hypothetical protein
MAETETSVVFDPEGNRHLVTHPVGASQEDIVNYAKQHAAAPDVGTDVAKSVGVAPLKTAIGLAGSIGDIGGALDKGVNYVAENYLGIKPPPEDKRPPNIYDYLGSEGIRKGVEKVTGPIYNSKTMQGQYAGAVTEGVTGALLGPGSLLAKALMGAASGAGGQAAGQATQGEWYSPIAQIGGGLIGGIGAGGIGKGIEAIRNRGAAVGAGQQIGNALGTGPVKAAAVRRVAENIADEGITPQSAAARQSALGPEAMLLDLGGQLQGRAEAMALNPGKSQKLVLDAVTGRTGEFGSGTAARVKNDLDTYLGPSKNVVQTLDAVDAAVQKQAKPAYEKVMADYQKVGVPENITERPAIQQAMSSAKSIAANYGEKLPDTPSQGLRYWDYVKKGLDQRINTMMRSGMDDLSSAQKADLGGLMNAKAALVYHLDTVTNGAYADARKIASTKPELHEAMDFGRSIFNSKLLPEEVAAHVNDMSIPAQSMARVGARRELERVLESVRNEGAKARSFLDTNNNKQKIAELFGPQAADAIERRIAAENQFQSATQQISANSRTATRNVMAKDTETPGNVGFNPTILGVLERPFRAGLAYSAEHGMKNTREGISQILTAKEQQIPAVVKALLNYNSKRASNASTPLGLQASALARALIAERVSQ